MNGRTGRRNNNRRNRRFWIHLWNDSHMLFQKAKIKFKNDQSRCEVTSLAICLLILYHSIKMRASVFFFFFFPKIEFKNIFTAGKIKNEKRGTSDWHDLKATWLDPTAEITDASKKKKNSTEVILNYETVGWQRFHVNLFKRHRIGSRPRNTVHAKHVKGN